MKTSRIFGFDILNVKKTELFEYFDNFLINNKPAKTQVVFTPNPEQIVLAKHNQFFANHLKKADWLLPDGIGLVWASCILEFFGKTEEEITERIAGVELVEHLLETIAKYPDYNTLIIGGRDYVGSFEGEFFEDIKSLKKIKNNLYWTQGYQEKTEILPIEEEALEKIISRLKPKIVFVALGAPDQEKWIIEHLDLLNKNQAKIAVAVGGSFDFLFAKVTRAPQLWQKIGLEWLWRLIKQPWRRKRQLRLLNFLVLLSREVFTSTV